MALNRGGRVGPLLGMLVPIAGSSDFQAVVTGSAEFAGTTMTATDLYVFTCDIDCYVKQGAAPTAAASDGSMFVPAGMPLLIDGAQGAKLAVLRAGASDGVATMQKVALVA